MSAFEYYNDILCVQAGWLYSEGEILSQSNYNALKRRNRLNVLRRGCNGHPALVEFDTMPPKFKQAIIEQLGDPHKTTKHYKFKDYLKNDLDAVKYFSDFTLDNGDSLPQDTIKEYVANAVVLNAIHDAVTDMTQLRKALGGRASKIWNKVSEIIQDLPRHTYPHSLPQNVRRLKDKYRSYKKEGYYSLIHRGFCNKNSEKIQDIAKPWILSRWADRVDRVANTAQLLTEYNKRAVIEGWKEIKEAQTLYNYLHQSEVECLWHGHRYGELKAKEKFAYQHSTKLPTLRDSLWYSDGTKLNYYYQDENGNVKTCQVYEVMDAYSEVLLGYHISPTEDYEAQYFAFKMAAKVSGHRPYELRFDNQGGHKKLEAGDLFSRLARLSIKTQPYNGKSKTIESAFGRFQSQFLKRDWFFTGQNITAVRNESKANMENIMANKSNLPTLEEIHEIYAQRRREWNESIHYSTGEPRLEMYSTSENPLAPALELWDMIDLFWITRKKAVQLTAYGLTFTEKKAKYSYMLYTDNGLPDLKWLQRNIDNKFVVKFDPEDMSLIHVYKDTPSGLRHVTPLTTKVEIHRGKQEQEEWEAAFIKQVNEANKQNRMETVLEMDEILEAHGASNEDYGLNSPSVKGVNSKRKKSRPDNYGKVQKQISNTVEIDEADDSIYQMM